MPKRRPIGTLSAETASLITYFVGLSFGVPISFAAVSKAVGFEVTSSLDAYTSARRIVERDHRVFIDTLRCFGFQRGDGLCMADSMYPIARRADKAGRKLVSRGTLAIESNLPPAKHREVSEGISRGKIISSTAHMPRAKTNTPPPPPPPPRSSHEEFLDRTRKIK